MLLVCGFVSRATWRYGDTVRRFASDLWLLRSSSPLLKSPPRAPYREGGRSSGGVLSSAGRGRGALFTCISYSAVGCALTGTGIDHRALDRSRNCCFWGVAASGALLLARWMSLTRLAAVSSPDSANTSRPSDASPKHFAHGVNFLLSQFASAHVVSLFSVLVAFAPWAEARWSRA